MATPLFALLALLPAEAPPGAHLPPPGGPAPRIAERLAQAQAEALAATTTDPDTALARLYQALNLAHLAGLPRAADPMLAALEARTRDPLVAAHASLWLVPADLAAGRIEAAAARARGLGLLDAGLVAGPFPSASGSGHDERHPPEASLDLDRPMDARGAPVRWSSFAGLAPFGRIDVKELSVASGEATAYVLFAVRSPAPWNAALRLGATERFKVWQDGRLLVSEDSGHRAEVDQLAVPVVLPAGESVFLLKNTWDGGRGELIARFTGPRGEPPPKGFALVTSADELRPIVARPARVAEPAKHGVEAPWTRLDRALATAKGPRRAELLGLRSTLVARLASFDPRKLPIPPVVDLEEAIGLVGERADLAFFLAFRLARTAPARAEALFRGVVEKNPRDAPARVFLARLLAENDQWLEARQHLVAATEAEPAYAEAWIERSRLESRAFFARHQAKDLLLAESLATNPAVLGARAELEFRAQHRAAAIDLATRALAADFTDDGARRLLESMHVEAGRLEPALALADEAVRLHPERSGLYVRRARLAAAARGLDEGLRAIARDLGHFPRSAELVELEAELSLRRGDRERAVAAFDAALAIDPDRARTRRRRDLLTGGGDELADRFTVDVFPLIERPVEPEEAEEGAAVLLERTAVKLFPNGQSSRFVQTVLRLTNSDLADALRARSIGYSPGRETVEILSAERITKDGEVYRPSRIGDDGPSGKVGGMYLDARYRTIQFDQLEPGDLVHLRYRVDSFGENLFGGFFGDVVALSDRIPKRDVSYVVIAPSSRKLVPSVIRAPAPSVEERDGQTELAWHLDRVPAIAPEQHSPPYPELGSMALVTTYARWEELGEWYARLFKDQLELDDDARAAGRKVVAGASSDDEKIRRLYGYVVKNTRYVGIELGIHGWKPFKAADVHRRAYGDCKDKATLLAALLVDNGIPATIALVRTSDRGRLPDDHATMWAFNHAITYVPSADLFLDGTAEYSGSRELPYLDQDAQTLVVHPDGRIEHKRPPESRPIDNLNQSRYEAQIGPDGTLLLDGFEEFHGARATQVRQEYQAPEGRRRELERTLNQILPGAEVIGHEFSELSDLERPASYRYQVRAPSFGRVDGRRMLLPLTLFPHQVSNVYGTEESKSADLVVGFAWSTRNVVRYRLPRGARIVSLPEGRRVDTPYLALEQSVTRTEEGFMTDDTVTLKTRRVPAAAYPDFRAALLAIDRALERSVEVEL